VARVGKRQPAPKRPVASQGASPHPMHFERLQLAVRVHVLLQSNHNSGPYHECLPFTRYEYGLFTRRYVYSLWSMTRDATQFRDAWAPHTHTQRHGVLAMMIRPYKPRDSARYLSLSLPSLAFPQAS